MAAPGPSERGLEVGVQDGFSIWRLDVIGSFLKFQQHGHLKRGEQMDPWDSGRTRDLAAGLCAPQSLGRGGGERPLRPGGPALWSRYAERPGYTGATLSRGDASQNGTPVPARCSLQWRAEGRGQASYHWGTGALGTWLTAPPSTSPARGQPRCHCGPDAASSRTPLLMSSPNPSVVTSLPLTFWCCDPHFSYAG